jgi:hypothetical protein
LVGGSILSISGLDSLGSSNDLFIVSFMELFGCVITDVSTKKLLMPDKHLPFEFPSFGITVQ